MPRRLNTIIIVPHTKAKFVKISFSTRTFLLGVCGVLVALVLSAIAIAYTGSAVSRRAEVQRLDSENQQLVETNKQLQVTAAEVQARLEEFENQTARLALAAGMDTETVDPGVGNQAEAVGRGGPYDRIPESPAVLRLQSDWIGMKLREVEEKLLIRDQKLACTPTIAPTLGVITDGFGSRKDPFTGRPAFHRGLDISARRGTPVLAPADGVVVFAGRNGGLGKVLRLSHGFGYTTVFGHLDKTLVEPGEEVHRGQQIGVLGNTGRSTGPHLHYEVHVDGKAVNPLYHILDAF
jgi:murein DD-endopeptidase MepM/ murein hydrolase activator NlpD